MEIEQLQRILEGALLASNKPLTLDQMMTLFPENEIPDANEFREALVSLSESCEDRGFELKQVASGYRFQVRQELAPWVGRLWEEKPQRYTRALLETLALIAYRQPITRGEIEDIRGVSVSSNIIRTLQEREWIRVVGHRDVPGRPAMFATTRQFLDYFSLQNLNELPPLSEIRDLEEIARQLNPEQGPEQGSRDVEQGNANAASDIHEVVEVEEQSAEALFAQLDEMEADLPDNFDDLIKKQKVDTLDLENTTEAPADTEETTTKSPDSNNETAEDSV